jgi:hypothetical protein
LQYAPTQLLETIKKMVTSDIIQTPRLPEIRADHQQILDKMYELIDGYVPELYPENWVALKLLEGDKEITRKMQLALPPEKWSEVQDLLKEHDDAMLAIASGRYEWIGRLTRAAITHPRIGQISLTDRLDRWAAHPVMGLVILALILGIVFGLTFTLGSPAQTWLDKGLVVPFGNLVNGWLSAAPDWLRSLLVHGVIGGVGAVLTFLPILIVFFATFGFLEDVGYMARAAYVMDNFMHWMGLHGKSFLPLFLGFGCNVPAVIGTRVIDSRKSRLLTILLAPFVPCTARMAVLAFLAPAFFSSKAIWVIWGLVFFSLFVLVLLGVILNRVLFKGERSAFIMEMPLYHIPNLRTIGMLIWQRSLSFVKKAGTTILIWRQDRDQLPGRHRPLCGTRRALDGHGLEINRGPAHQFCGKRKLNCHTGHPVWRHPGVGAGAKFSLAIFHRHRSWVPDRLALVHPLRGHHGGHQTRDRLVEMDLPQHCPDAGGFGGSRSHDVPYREGSGIVICLKNCWLNSRTAAPPPLRYWLKNWIPRSGWWKPCWIRSSSRGICKPLPRIAIQKNLVTPVDLLKCAAQRMLHLCGYL